MNEMESLLKALHQVNLDIEGMLKSGAKDEKIEKLLSDAREYRAMLESDIRHEAIKANSQRNPKTEEIELIGVIVII